MYIYVCCIVIRWEKRYMSLSETSCRGKKKLFMQTICFIKATLYVNCYIRNSFSVHSFIYRDQWKPGLGVWPPVLAPHEQIENLDHGMSPTNAIEHHSSTDHAELGQLVDAAYSSWTNEFCPAGIAKDWLILNLCSFDFGFILREPL